MDSDLKGSAIINASANVAFEQYEVQRLSRSRGRFTVMIRLVQKQPPEGRVRSLHLLHASSPCSIDVYCMSGILTGPTVFQTDLRELKTRLKRVLRQAC